MSKSYKKKKNKQMTIVHKSQVSSQVYMWDLSVIQIWDSNLYPIHAVYHQFPTCRVIQDSTWFMYFFIQGDAQRHFLLEIIVAYKKRKF